jgi:hypothetical protein
MCVVCVLCLIEVPLPPGETPFSVKINNNNKIRRGRLEENAYIPLFPSTLVHMADTEITFMNTQWVLDSWPVLVR